MSEVTIPLSFGTLRRLRDDDAESMARHANDRRVSLQLRDRFPFPYAPEDARSFIELIAADDPQLHFGIEIGGEVVGAIGLQPLDDVERLSAEIGYWLSVEFWGKGIMPEAVRAVTDHGHRSLGCRRIFAKVFCGNARSERVLEKAGFCLEGRLRSAVIKEGRLLDALLYAHVV